MNNYWEKPWHLKEMIGNDSIKEQILRCSSQERYPKNILFSGENGEGKNVSASLLLSTMTCIFKTADGDICGRCFTCRDFLFAQSVYHDRCGSSIPLRNKSIKIYGLNAPEMSREDITKTIKKAHDECGDSILCNPRREFDIDFTSENDVLEGVVLVFDEIHRMSKSNQDILLNYMSDDTNVHFVFMTSELQLLNKALIDRSLLLKTRYEATPEEKVSWMKRMIERARFDGFEDQLLYEIAEVALSPRKVVQMIEHYSLYDNKNNINVKKDTKHYFRI